MGDAKNLQGKKKKNENSWRMLVLRKLRETKRKLDQASRCLFYIFGKEYTSISTSFDKVFWQIL